MMHKDEIRAYQAIRLLAETASKLHLMINYDCEYDFTDDELWQARAYLWRKVEKMQQYLNIDRNDE